ncbi:MAG: 1,2-phenylacetyl-CoA epoxidase subunit PaaC [Bacteroidota bacterium]
MKEDLFEYLLMLGDNSMILGHRLSELCGHGPTLETDIALTNMSLDLFGEVRSLFQYAAQVKGGGATEDSVAMLRSDREYRHVWLVEQPNTDFGHVIGRQFFYDNYHLPLLEQLTKSKDATVAAIAAKSVKESRYHLRFSAEWVKRLGDGTEESHQRMQSAIDHLYPFVAELYQPTPIERDMLAAGVGADLEAVQAQSLETIEQVLADATLSIPEGDPRMTMGKQGIHSEHLGYILSDLQYMQRAYPNMQW